jgi:predicted ester cyclase
MSTAEMKRIARRIPAELSKGNIKVLDELAAPDGVDHSASEVISRGPEGMKKALSDLMQAFRDLRYKLEDEIVEGDLVVQRTTASGTMKGPWMGMQPTGRKASWTEIHTLRFRDGKFVEHWANIDFATMMMQLGLVAMPAPQAQAMMAEPAGGR